MTEKAGFDLNVFPVNAHMTEKSGSFEVKSYTIYRIGFTIGKVYPVLSFSNTVPKPTTTEGVSGYEIYFTKELLDKEAIILSEKLELFKSELPAMFLVKRHQEWRVREIFESLLNESTKTDIYRDEMMRTLIHILLLFSERLIRIGSDSA